METSQSSSGLAAYFGALQRRRRLIGLIGAPILLAALVLAFALPDIYQSSGMVSIEQQRLEGVRSSTSTASDNYIQEYVRSISNTMLKSQALLPVVKELDLYPDLKDKPEEAAGRMAGDSRIDMVRSTILDPSSGREREIISGFRISYSNSDPKLAYLGANWLTNQLILVDRSNRAGRENETAAFFAKEAERVSEEMGALEQKLADHRRRNFGRSPDLAAVNMNSLDRIERDLENAQAQISMLRKDRVFIQQRLAESNSTYGNADQLARAEEELRRKSATYDASHPDIVSLRRQIESLRLAGSSNAGGGSGASLQEQLDAQRATLAEARQRYSEDHPDIKRINRQIETLQSRIASGEKVTASNVRTAASEQLEVQLRSTDTEIAGLEMRAAELRGKLGTVENRMASTPEVEREEQLLTRDVTQARTKYEQLLASRMDAEITRTAITEGKADEFRLLQPAFQPTSPAKPARVAIVIIGAILSAVIALIAVSVAEFLDPTVRSARDLQMVLNVTPLAVVPKIQTAAALTHDRRMFQLACMVMLAGTVLLFVGVRAWVS